MKKSLCLLGAASLAILSSLSAANAQDVAGFELSGNVSYTTDYRFRGVSLSGTDFALQGGFDAVHSSGFYVGTWASSINAFEGSETELDGYVGYGFEAGAFSFDVGAIGYFYPGSDDTEYYEVYGSGSTDLGIVGVTLGFAYAPDQENLGDEDNTYIYADASIPFVDSPYSIALHIGLEDGAFGDEKQDYAIGLEGSFELLDISLMLIDTDQEDADGFGELAEEALVFTVGKSF